MQIETNTEKDKTEALRRKDHELFEDSEAEELHDWA